MERKNITIDISNLKDAQQRAIAKQMLKIVLARMTPEQRKNFIQNVNAVAYKAELLRKLQKHKKILAMLVLPLMPITQAHAMLKLLLLKKKLAKQVLTLFQQLKLLKEMSSGSYLISPERKQGTEAKIQEDYSS